MHVKKGIIIEKICKQRKLHGLKEINFVLVLVSLYFSYIIEVRLQKTQQSLCTASGKCPLTQHPLRPSEVTMQQDVEWQSLCLATVTMQSDLANQIFSSNEILVRCICQVIRLITFNALDTLFSTSSPAHLFNIRGKRKRGPGTVQIRD